MILLAAVYLRIGIQRNLLCADSEFGVVWGTQGQVGRLWSEDTLRSWERAPANVLRSMYRGPILVYQITMYDHPINK